MTKYARTAGGNYSADATWSTTSGGAADTVKPDATDDVVFDANSGNVTVDATAVAKTIDQTGYTNTLTHNAFTLTVSGSVTLAATKYTTSGAATLAMNATGTLISAGNTLYNLTTSVGTITLGDASNISNLFTHTSGTLITDGGAGTLTHNWYIFYSYNSNTRTITLGNSTINISANNTSWDMTAAANLTLNADTSTINMTGSNADLRVGWLSGGSKTFNIVNFTGSGNAVVTSGYQNTFATLTRTGTAVKTDGFIIYGQDIVVTGTLSLAGNSATNRLLVKSYILGSAHTITVTGANLTGTTNVDFMDITFADNKVGDTDLTNGGANSIGDAGGNTRTLGTGNLVMTTAVKQYWQTVAGGTWSTVANWTSRVPLPQDDVDLGNTALATPITYNSGVTVTADMPRLGKSISWTGAGYTGTKPTWTFSTSNSVYGSLTLISGMTFSQIGTTTFYGRASYIVTSAGQSFAGLAISAPGGTYTLQDALIAGEMTVINGGLITAGKSVTTGFFASSNSNVRTVDISGSQVNMTSGGTGWGFGTTPNLTFVSTGSTIAMAGNSGFFSSGQIIYNDIFVAPGAGILTIYGPFTFHNMTMSSAGTRTVKFTKSTTYTMTGTNFLSGTSGNLVTIDSDDGATQFTLSKASGTVVVDYVSLARSIATGGATFQATNSTDVGGNTGWIFGTVVLLSALALTATLNSPTILLPESSYFIHENNQVKLYVRNVLVETWG